MIFADGKGGKMEQVEKWCRVHKKACLAWTVTSYEIWDKIKPYVDNIIFEGFSLD